MVKLAKLMMKMIKLAKLITKLVTPLWEEDCDDPIQGYRYDSGQVEVSHQCSHVGVKKTKD